MMLEVVAAVEVPARYWVTDRRGVVRAALVVEGEEEAWRSLRYRSGQKDSWREVWRGRGREDDFWPIGITDDDQHLVVIAYGDHDTRGVYEFDPASGELTREIIRRPNVDLIDVVLDYGGEPIAAVYEEAGRREYVYFESFREKYLPENSLPKAKELGPGSVEVVSSSRDHRFLALRVQGARQPGVFYFYDKQEQKLTQLAEVNPRLKPADLADVEALEVAASDGTRLEAYLALPDRPDGTLPPLVVYPHGGPIGIRDFGGFDPVTQYFANGGLAVLRVNYRGSGGYGRSFEAAGQREWGRGIEDDIDGVVQRVVEGGAVDANRMCIVGGSYGGYSAVMSAIRHPERYRCAATLNGVTDLPLLIAHDSLDPRLRERMVEIVGDPESEFERMMEVSPVYHVEDLRAPVLIVNGALDLRVDPEHSYRLQAMLEAYGKPYEWLEIPQMGHCPTSEEWVKVAEALRWFVQCHLGEIQPPESKTWRGHTCRSGRRALQPKPRSAASRD